MEQLLELLAQIEELAGAGKEAVAAALGGGGEAGAAPEAPPEGPAPGAEQPA